MSDEIEVRKVAWCVNHDSLGHRKTGDPWEPEYDWCDDDYLRQGMHRIGSMCEIVDAELHIMRAVQGGEDVTEKGA